MPLYRPGEPFSVDFVVFGGHWQAALYKPCRSALSTQICLKCGMSPPHCTLHALLPARFLKPLRRACMVWSAIVVGKSYYCCLLLLHHPASYCCLLLLPELCC
jgi:hypothetical protein